ncbi:unnamed protein product [Gulo gulo]|uniref:Uncharacterized protein n=1 Tax=Gulo gulo TaxID=48420 RepID=A0A9X9Q4K1_GULGU|nr:unnamed protein product [Gulo gulo]
MKSEDGEQREASKGFCEVIYGSNVEKYSRLLAPVPLK